MGVVGAAALGGETRRCASESRPASLGRQGPRGRLEPHCEEDTVEDDAALKEYHLFNGRRGLGGVRCFGVKGRFLMGRFSL